MVINAGGPMLEATILLLAPNFFRGPRALLVIVLGMVTDIACGAGVGWPIFTALNAQASQPVKYLAAILTMLLGVGLVQAIAILGTRANRAPVAGGYHAVPAAQS
jgi:hypothetical protein